MLRVSVPRCLHADQLQPRQGVLMRAPQIKLKQKAAFSESNTVKTAAELDKVYSASRNISSNRKQNSYKYVCLSLPVRGSAPNSFYPQVIFLNDSVNPKKNLSRLKNKW